MKGRKIRALKEEQNHDEQCDDNNAESVSRDITESNTNHRKQFSKTSRVQSSLMT